MLTSLLILAVCFVAFTNGANANFKGVASLYGSGTTSRQTALYSGTATTLAGSIAAAFISTGMMFSFSGREILPDSLVQTPNFIAAVALGAALTSFLANRLGFPVSTTHAIVGALAGAGLAGNGASIHFAPLAKNFLYPLLFSPAIAIVLGATIYPILKSIRLAPDQRNRTLDILHFISSGAASFARGLNDTPKMAALLAITPGFMPSWAFSLVGLMIAIGALTDSRRVAETLGKKVTDMNPGQGFAASLVTAGLVTTASLHSLPVSTTHVSVGSLLGMGAVTGKAHWRKAGEILLAWICTLPCGAILAGLSYLVISRF